MGPGKDPALKSFRGNSSLSQLCLRLFLQAHKMLGWRADPIKDTQNRQLGLLEWCAARRNIQVLKGSAEFPRWTMRSQNPTPFRRTGVKWLASSLPGMCPEGQNNTEAAGRGRQKRVMLLKCFTRIEGHNHEILHTRRSQLDNKDT